MKACQLGTWDTLRYTNMVKESSLFFIGNTNLHGWNFPASHGKVFWNDALPETKIVPKK